MTLQQLRRNFFLSLVASLLFLLSLQSIEGVRRKEIGWLVSLLREDALTALHYRGCALPGEAQHHAATILKQLGRFTVANPSVALRDEDEAQRFLAAFTLAEAHPPNPTATIPALRLALQDSSPDVRMLAFKGLSEMKAITIAELSTALDDRDGVQLKAVKAIHKMDSEARSLAPQLLEIAVHVDRNWCTSAMAESALKSLGGLENIKASEAVFVLRQALQTSEQATRETALRYLALMGSAATTAIPDLEAVLANQKDNVLHEDAAYTLQCIQERCPARLEGG
uniref:PBS lyase HEAT domain protein repeat-containing protein n=1 Tax=Cyanothece sp. (strain PCC 7425 / ATCC 29141) TaxID=395961 RepID=B8HL95_CYAP4